MAEYVIKSKGKKQFSVTCDDKIIGEFDYYSPSVAQRENQNYRSGDYCVKPKGFFKTEADILFRDEAVCSIESRWNGIMIINFALRNGVLEEFTFKNRSILKSDFSVLDQIGHELLTVRPRFIWKNLNYEYTITTSDMLERSSDKFIFLMAAMHCSNVSLATSFSAFG